MYAFDNFLKNARFLVIDDEPVSASAVEISLAAAGQDNVRIVNDPCEAVEVYREYRPDIILLDISMPVMDGFDVLDQLRMLMPPDDHLPVIVITADPMEATRRRALAAGASDFLTKPFGSTELRLRVRNLLETRFLQLGLREQNRRLDERVTERTQELEAALEELRQTQRQAIRQERLHAFSEMAGGVVHDFNNVLMILMSLADLIAREAPPPPESDIGNYATTMQSVLQEAVQMIARLHYFCRPRHDDDLFMPTDLKKLVEDAVNLAKPKWHTDARAGGREIRLSLSLARIDLFPCNVSEMREALFHLILNAVDAMPQGGTLSLALKKVEDGIELSVTDTGIGMTEEVRARCMDPFYSTKAEPGAGLGLAMVHGIIRRHAGELDVTSQLGAGSTFRIFLPRANAATQAARPRQPAMIRPLRILLAEDDDRLRQLIALQMESMGHIVEAAADGNQALQKFHEAPFDLILTDLSMPRLNGLALVEAARQIIAEIPVIMLTGFGAMLLPDGERPPGVDILLSKPVTRDNLAAAIAQVAA
jgi:CheY-like chemotaxis protein